MTTYKTRDELFAEYFEDREGSAKVAEHAYRQGWKDRATYTVVPDGTPSVPPIALAGEPDERKAFRGWFETSGFWNNAITEKAWIAACAWQRAQDAAPTPSASSVPVALTKEQIAKESLGLDWLNVESQARSVCGWAADLMSKSGKRAMPNLDDDWSPISETLVHRLRDPIPTQALADMPERMAEAINVIREEAADAIENLCAQYRELEYSMECCQNAKAAATLNLNLESGLGDGGLLDASLEAHFAAPMTNPAPSVATFFEVGTAERGSAIKAAMKYADQTGFGRSTFGWCSVFADALVRALLQANGATK